MSTPKPAETEAVDVILHCPDCNEYDNSKACGDCGESLSFANGVGCCLDGCGELHGFDEETGLWTPTFLADRREKK